MAIQLGDAAPNFTAETTEGTINFHEYLGDGWGILFSHPADFTPVWTTELGAVAKLRDEFARHNTKVIAVSVDPLHSHQRWVGDIEAVTGARLNFPLIADPQLVVANLYGMIHPNASSTMTVRSVFVIGPDKKVKLMPAYPASTGRDFGQILRVLKSLQLTARYKVTTPADWRGGEEGIITMAVSDEEAASRFRGYTRLEHHLRMTAQPL
jgi:alkyl hydroperoxide reductase subunit AhpC